jgi:hypothetical protein
VQDKKKILVGLKKHIRGFVNDEPFTGIEENEEKM